MLISEFFQDKGSLNTRKDAVMFDFTLSISKTFLSSALEQAPHWKVQQASSTTYQT